MQWCKVHPITINYASIKINHVQNVYQNLIIINYHSITLIASHMQQLNRKYIIGPSILAADFGYLVKECQEMLDLGANSLHIDIMDGHFVPNLTIGAPVVASLRKNIPLVHFDCHLMVSYPRHYIQPLAKAGANCFTFHYEVEQSNIDQLCECIRNHKMEVGLSVKPKTQIDDRIQKLIEEKRIDKLLVMTVEPGFGGQKFMGDMMRKVKYLHGKYPNLDIQVDGGIGPENAEQVVRCGANWLVAGSAVFNAKDRRQVMKDIDLGIKRASQLSQ